MPTGAGKSLTYQLPAVFLSKPVLVVSPLIALMQDQQEKAADAAIAVEKIDSSLTRVAAEAAHESIDTGHAQLIYCTPERLLDEGFRTELKHGGGVGLFVVDEGPLHLQWGHDFRPAYIELGRAREQLGNPPLLALTATATEAVVEEILHTLCAPEATVINNGSERTNLHLAVQPTVNLDAKYARLTELLAEEDWQRHRLHQQREERGGAV